MHRTRLAPSPTGALHLGNARTFLVTWALARQFDWQIILRIEDLDGPRIKAEFVQQAIDDLTWLGLDWDEGPYTQRSDLTPYQTALIRLAAGGWAYPCRCTRREIQAEAWGAPQAGDHEVRYRGTCRQTGLQAAAEWIDRLRAQSPQRESPTPTASESDPGFQSAWRLIVDDETGTIEDHVAGTYRENLQHSVGDFLIWTKQGLPSYQLAVVVDDARQVVDRVVRGADLLSSALRQREIYRKLKLVPRPDYYHLPLVVGSDGRRLAKRHGDTRIAAYREAGVSPGTLISLLASWSGLAPPLPHTASEFRNRFCLNSLPKSPARFD